MNKITLGVAFVVIVLVLVYVGTTFKSSAPEEQKEGTSLPESNSPEKQKEDIIAAILQRQELFASGNIPEIRKHFSKYQVHRPEEYARVAQLSDSALRSELEFLTMVEFTESELRSPTAEWEVTDREARIRFKPEAHGGGTMTTMVSAFKVDGVWY